jgi:signal transduction histidine kinase
MSLRSKIVLILVVVVVLYAAIEIGTLRYAFNPIFEGWERTEAKKELDRARARLESEKHELSGNARIYAELDEVHRFALAPSAEFIASDLGPGVLESAGVDLFYLCDAQGRVLWGLIVDPATRAPIRLREMPAEALNPDGPLNIFSGKPRSGPRSSDGEPSEHVAGLMMTERWPLLVSSSPIRDAQGRAFADGPEDYRRPLYGTVILGRFLDPELLEHIAGEAGPTIAVTRIDESRGEDRSEIVDALTGGQELVIAVGEDGRRHAYATEQDLRTGQVLLLDAAVEREITATGRTVVSVALLSTLGGALLILFVLLRLLLRIVIRPLSTLTSKVIEIGKRDDTSIRVALEREDEIGLLSGEFDKMLEKLAQSREQVVQTARLAGRSEIATGVLHNVGNVLNSVNVSSNLASKKAEEFSTADLEMLVGVLQKHEQDLGAFVSTDPRGKHLVPFLNELARSLVVQKKALQEELSGLNQGIEHIAELVRAQQSFTGTKGVFEKASLAAQVDAALRITSQALNETGGIEVVREFADLPAVTVDKHKLMEILVNLITNAAQALAEGGNPAKRLTLRIARADERTARIEVEDTGVGIPAENLTRIFHHGFTTKKNGHGFGLHVSANAATEMKAKLHAKSAGPGRGATFALDIPMEEEAALASAA